MQTANSVASLRTVLTQADTALIATRSENEAIRVRLGETEKDLEEARAAEERTMRALAEAQHQIALEVEKSRQAEERITAADEETRRLQAQILNLTSRAQEAEERAGNATESARRSEAQMEALLAEVGTLRDEAMEEAKRNATDREKAAEEIKRCEAEAERKVAEAVATFRQSDDYKKDLGEASARFYDLGFSDCKLKVKLVYNLEGVEDLEPDPVEDSVPPTPQEDDAAPAEPQSSF